jgi:hypothetical protein
VGEYRYVDVEENELEGVDDAEELKAVVDELDGPTNKGDLEIEVGVDDDGELEASSEVADAGEEGDDELAEDPPGVS